MQYAGLKIKYAREEDVSPSFVFIVPPGNSQGTSYLADLRIFKISPNGRHTRAYGIKGRSELHCMCHRFDATVIIKVSPWQQS